ncbi:ankyrin repeat domain-containing protein [Variovorax sp. RKNM96]|uniref:ankyrin repeat domain-containing protein n=1 Tax=Variovorax sp. RKNM96 TaxID=2681552 RepID=UPI00198054CF|nr:ankyrin repeat domain-containing protein [Variovorax sp. RKNM96]QSI33305.1 ankyrin repeat domain-containing protein [Variovorax sp. RKNM96]
MGQLLSELEPEELRREFKDVLNYDADDVCDPIDPLTYIAPDGDTWLHIAAHRGNLRAVQMLVKAGLVPDRQGDMGYAALHYASTPEVVEFLLGCGALRTIKNEFGNSPVGWKDAE